MALTQTAHQLITAHFKGKATSLAVDATCGNGHDTLFLCQLGFNEVIGFDIQTRAIAQTQARLDDHKQQAMLYHTGHDTLSAVIKPQTGQKISEKPKKNIDCLMFNLGYLPGTDKSVTTQVTSTLSALQQGCELLSPHGLISILCYPGHNEGALEQQAIKKWLSTLQTNWHVHEQQSVAIDTHTPVLYLITRQL